MQGRKIATLLISLLAAFLLWLYVITSIAPEATARISDIPVTVDGSIVLEERGLIITDQRTENIWLEVSASRVNLTKLNSSSIRISADASKIREPGTYELSYSVIYPDTVNSNDVDILRQSTSRVTVTVSRLETKTVPAVISWQGSVPEGYTAETGSATLNPEEVTLTGPTEEISRITEARVVFDLSAMNETVIQTIPFTFYDEDGNIILISDNTTVSAESATLTLQILRSRQVSLQVELVEGNGVTADNAVVTFSTESITVKGNAEVVDAMDDVLIVGSPIELSKIRDQQTFRCNLNLPAGVTSDTGETTVEVTVAIVGISKASIPVTDIRVINQMEGYETRVTSKSVDVTVRGATSEVNQLRNSKNNGIYILVDLEGNTQTGSFTVVGTVVNDAHPDVGVVDEAQVSVSVTPIAETPPETSEG